jgi:hydrogenase maturation protein HypF
VVDAVDASPAGGTVEASLAVERQRLRVCGTVQGVGFRPFVYRQANALGLGGFVLNDSAGVLIEAEGLPAQVAELRRVIVEDPPPLARVASVTASPMAPTGDAPEFVILESSAGGRAEVPVSVDTATCAACLQEVDDPSDRRFGYPFTNCTDCGPRYTIVVKVPYDRPATTMAAFRMCPSCQREYDDPADRRFHAQPNACPGCGPRLRWCTPAGELVADGPAALDAAVAALGLGAIVAIKGVGGFHLAVDAMRPAAVNELRRRKARDDKPFAVMVADLATARALCQLDGPAEAALVSPSRPIILAPRRPDATITVAAAIAPGLADLGLMLPYSALHHLLLRRLPGPLVMTSGNLSDDPIAHTDDDAIDRLGPLVDAMLTHDRPIHIRCDDSVGRAVEGGVQLLRRSRGFAPEPMRLVEPARRQVLALGAELKSTIAVANGTTLVASHHIGDLEHLASHRSFRQAVGHLCHLYGVVPEVVAHDLHPEYLSTKFAAELDLPTWPVQHHHAHIASCLVEHQRTGPVLGVAFDGLGFGTDGTLWGGEFLVSSLQGFERVGHLRPVPLPGGTAAIREPWRMAVAWAHQATGADAAQAVGRHLDERADALIALIERGEAMGMPRTTSAGRLFDAVAALCGVRSAVTYEGQAAIELEALARSVPRSAAPHYPVGREWVDGRLVLDPAPLVSAVMASLASGTPSALVAAGFHETMAQATASAATELAARHGLGTVALSGGVFQNVRLAEAVANGLKANGLDVLVHRQIPPNDGGISLGQAAIAAAATANGGKGTH